MTDWRTPRGEVLDKQQGEGKLDDDGGDSLIVELSISVCAVMVVATVCALALHWAGLI
jgi:hypothetical protein